jgi:hypothetical protein
VDQTIIIIARPILMFNLMNILSNIEQHHRRRHLMGFKSLL